MQGPEMARGTPKTPKAPQATHFWLSRLGAMEWLEALVDDVAPVIRYDFEGGELVNTTVGALARGTLATLASGPR